VNKILYLMFTEGYLSVNHELSIRQELCDEAIRLATILANNKVGQIPETFALLALMNFHMARMTARQDSSGGLILLEQQDRLLWDKQKIQAGLVWLEKSSKGDNFSRYHAEAGIAAEHCLAKSFQQTRWDRIAENYLLLEQVSPSVIHRLNRAVAVAEWQDPATGLAILNGFEPPDRITGSFLWRAVLADLHRRNGDINIARGYHNEALKLAPTPAIKELLEQRFKKGEAD
ncbi:MAG: RNA polymerase subunit sigma-70, partial [Methylococcaceae bacterium]|nr:RNA polymerase subunit sigma-70 [Methylococcaceae bacterium]